MADRNSFYTVDQTPFITAHDLFRGIGSIGRSMGFVPREADLQNYPRFPRDPRLDVLLPSNQRPTKKDKRIISAAHRANKARTALDVELETSQIGRMMKLQDEDARYARARDLALAGSNAMVGSGRRPLVVPPSFVGADTQGAQPPPPPGYTLPGSPLDTLLGQTALGGANMGHPLVDPTNQAAASLANQDDMQARIAAATAPQTLPPDRQMPSGGHPFSTDNLDLSPEMQQLQNAATLANQDDAVAALRGPPVAGASGIAALSGARTGQPFIPHGLAGQTVLGGANTGIPPLNPGTVPRDGSAMGPPAVDISHGLPTGHTGNDPNAPSNRLYNAITSDLPDYIRRHLPEGAGTGPGPDPDAFAKQLTAATKPRGPYGSGGTDMGDALIAGGDIANAGLNWAVEKGGDLYDLIGTLPTPYELGAKLRGGGKDKGKGETTVDPSLDPTLPPDEALPDGTTKEDTSTSDLDKRLDKYLTESDTSYDDALKTINAAYGGLEQPQKDPRQDAADAYAARDADRTAALAQLAMAGGLIKSAGKSWEGAGQGVMDAAGVYSQGFDRYQKALNDSADRAYTRQQADRAFEISKRGAALTMWQSGQTDRRAMIKDLFTLEREDRKQAASDKRSLDKDTRDHIDKVFTEQAKIMFPSDGTADTESDEYKSKLAAFRDAWRRSYTAGQIVFPEDMATTVATDVRAKK